MEARISLLWQTKHFAVLLIGHSLEKELVVVLFLYFLRKKKTRRRAHPMLYPGFAPWWRGGWGKLVASGKLWLDHILGGGEIFVVLSRQVENE